MTSKRVTEPHPAAGCTKAQIAAFERIACGDDTMLNPRTTEALLAKGLISEHKQMLPGHVGMVVKRYDVPIQIHILWCEWCAENVADGDE